MNDTLGNATGGSSIYPTIRLACTITDLTINLILVLPSNIYALWLILSGAGGTIASEFFYLNLKASVIVSILHPIFYLAWIFTQISTLGKIAMFSIGVFTWLCVPSFQCCICVERYIAVVHPVVFLRYKALRYRVACCCVVWLMVLALGLFWLFWSKQAGMYYFFLGFSIVCISVLSFCCLSVLRALKQPGPGEGQRDSGNDMKRKAFRIILISLVVMVATTIGYVPSVLFLGMRHTTGISAAAVRISITLSKLAGFVHPLLYIHKAGKLPCFN